MLTHATGYAAHRQWTCCKALCCNPTPNQGGRLNAATKQDVVHVINLGGQERLWYRAPKAIHIALLRGTTADTAGNVSFEHEPVYLDQLHQAMAAHNSGGKVIVQVQRVVAEGSIPPRHVHIPGALVDKVRVAYMRVLDVHETVMTTDYVSQL